MIAALALATVSVLQSQSQGSLDEAPISAIRSQDQTKAEASLKAGANPNVLTDLKEGRTALQFVAAWNASSLVKLLLDHKADVQLKDVRGNTTMHAAMWWAERGMWMGSEEACVDIVQRLASQGAAVDVANSEGVTPLMYAAREGHVPAMRTLIGLGANVRARDLRGRTPLTWGARKGKESETVSLLLGGGPSVGLTEALLMGDLELAKKLVSDPSVDATIPGPFSESTLSIACEKGDPQLVEALLKRGLSPNGRDMFGNTVLMLACGGPVLTAHGGGRYLRKDPSNEQNRYRVVASLLKAGAEVNAPKLQDDEVTCSALYIATMSKYRSVITLLKANGAKVRDREWLPPEDREPTPTATEPP